MKRLFPLYTGVAAYVLMTAGVWLWFFGAPNFAAILPAALSPLLLLRVFLAPVFPNDKHKVLCGLARGNAQLAIGLCLFPLLTATCVFTGIKGPALGAPFFVGCVLCAVDLYLLLWCGVLRVLLFSVQLGIKRRLFLLSFAWIPLVRLPYLILVCRRTGREYRFEREHMLENMVQAENEICCTKYPLLLVHGGFFRDLPILSYWGRIATEWKRNGATLFYGGQDSAAPVVVCAEQLKETLKEILAQTGCEKVNLIAHSKGGLDCRCLITKLGMADHVASLTTVCTPHHGAPYADWLLTKAPAGLRRFVVARYNAAFKRLGDKKPDFLGGVQDLTVKNTEIFNREVPNAPGVYYQSVGCYMRSCFSSPFPTNITYMIAYPFCGKNDGLVSPESAKWGEKFHLVNPSGLRGISHGDMIDLYRQNVRGFDVRKFYVNLVADLKKRGF